MKWPPTLCWTAPKTINGNRHFQVKAYGGKNEDRWVDIFPTKNKKDVKRTFFESNKEIFDEIYKVNKQKRIINFLNENSLDQETFNERISLLIDPQTCGPLLISCNPKYENILKDKWYKVGEVVKI